MINPYVGRETEEQREMRMLQYQPHIIIFRRKPLYSNEFPYRRVYTAEDYWPEERMLLVRSPFNYQEIDRVGWDENARTYRVIGFHFTGEVEHVRGCVTEYVDDPCDAIEEYLQYES